MEKNLEKKQFILPFHLVLACIAILFSFIYKLLFDTYIPGLTLVIGLVVSLLGLPLESVTNSSRVRAHFLITVLLGTLSVLVYQTGGFYSPAIWWVIFVPVMSAFTLDDIETIIWGLMALLFTLIMGLAHLDVIPFMNVLVGENIVVAYALSTFTFVVSVGFLIVSLKIKIQKFEEQQKFISDQNYILSNFNSLTELASGIAHEINNPLSIIEGHSEIISNKVLKSEIDDKERIANSISKIKSATTRATEIVKNLSFLTSKSHQKDFLFHFEIHNLIENLIKINKKKFLLKNIEIKSAKEEELFASIVYANEKKLSLVILNVLTNSYEAIGNELDSWIRFNYKKDQSFFYISITDSGKGLSPLIQDKIFRPLYTEKDVGQNNKGLGLSISKLIMKEVKGDIYLDKSQANTTFVIKIPL